MSTNSIKIKHGRPRFIKMIEMDGISVSQGITIGTAFVIDQEIVDFPKTTILKENIKQEIERLKVALDTTRLELIALQEQVSKTNDEKTIAEFFNFHLVIIEDPTFKEKVEQLINTKMLNTEWAVYDIIDSESKQLLSLGDDYLKDRVKDLHDIGKRLIRHLMKKEKGTTREIPTGSILIADDLDPSATATLDLNKVKGFVTNQGTKQSHTAILARAHNIPAVVGTKTVTQVIINGDIVIVDSNTGKVVINPDEKTLKIFKTAMSVYGKFRHSLEKLVHLDPVTKDNKRINIAGNIEIPEEADTIIRNGGFGIGLYRTEFFYMNRAGLPTEDELFQIFKGVVEKMNPAPVVFRTLDLGGDKFADTFLDQKNEMNPFLGWRAIRFCLENREIFSIQLRAMLRASAFGKVKIMIPMISDVSEIIKTEKIISDIKEELSAKKIAFDADIELGAMIEIPSAALTADSIAREVSFFSVGSNDLVQYTMAVDRNNPKIAYLFDPFHPAVLQLFKATIDSAKRHNIKVSICGELGAEPMAIPLLVGLGFDELSVAPTVIPTVKKIIRNIEYSYSQKMADKILSMDNSIDIHKYLKKAEKIFAPDLS